MRTNSLCAIPVLASAWRVDSASASSHHDVRQGLDRAQIGVLARRRVGINPARYMRSHRCRRSCAPRCPGPDKQKAAQAFAQNGLWAHGNVKNNDASLIEPVALA
jgi:hypothetical protein